jgi:ornithine cyclodeaminase
MRDCDILALSSADVAELLSGKELEIVHIVQQAYQAHGRGQSSLPHSTFLHFPPDVSKRIIALPAFLDGPIQSAGVKWISSFPGNLEHGVDRASAVLVLNSTATGRPKAIMEGSLISARRTAASAALAARTLQPKTDVVGLIGCGPINFEVLSFLLAVCPGIKTLVVYDLDLPRAEVFRERCLARDSSIDVIIAESRECVFESATLISFATTAGKPHVFDLKACAPGTVVLHVSLRDLSPEIILSADNVVDDVDHVCRAQTSIHLAEQHAGNRNFVRCTLPEILNGAAAPRRDSDSLVIFSPFGLGILDIALGQYVFQESVRRRKGTVLPSFLPDSWISAPVNANAIQDI